MGKLSKRDLKEQKKIQDLLNSKDKFTDDELELIYTEFNEAVIGDVTQNSAYFTPLGLAYDFALMVPTHGVVVDLCAGIGVLSHAALTRDYYHNDIKKIICIERDPRYIEIGKKLVQSTSRTYYEKGEEKEYTTEVIWLQGDMFDEEMWNQIEKDHGKIDCIISNPPYGVVTKSDKNRDWLKYKGKDIDIAAIEIGILKSKYPSYIIPQGSCTFKCSGRPYGSEHCENRKIDKLKKEIGLDFYMAWASIDTTVYEQGFKNTKITVECCTIVDVEAK